jgi:hypothetical protein
MIDDDDRVAEPNTGDYFPWWLNDLVTAILDPLPTLDQLKQMKAQWTHLTSQRISSNLFSRRELRQRVPN